MLDATASDSVLTEIADYVGSAASLEPRSLNAATLCLMDALGCAMAAVSRRDCQRHLGPIVPNAILVNGARVPGTAHILDPVRAAHNISAAIRWLDYNDTWLGTEWAHPSDNIGALLATADYVNRNRVNAEQSPCTMLQLLTALTRAYEIQGILALSTQFNTRGLDHVILVTVASAALSTYLLGGTRSAIVDAISHAFLDGVPLRLYRQGVNTGPRKSWAAAEASARGVAHALLVLRGEPGYPHVLTTPRYGFQDTIMGEAALRLAQPLSSYIVEHILFKVAYPCEFHAQSAAECAVQLHPLLQQRLPEIRTITLITHAAAKQIIDKSGPLTNTADRDHCLQYVVAVALLHGQLESLSFEDSFANDPRIDELRTKMTVIEDPGFTLAYRDPSKRAVANRVIVDLIDGTRYESTVEFPLGHPQRRSEAVPLLQQKFKQNLAGLFTASEIDERLALFMDNERLLSLSVDQFMNLWTRTPC